MPELENLKMADLLKAMRGDIMRIEEARNARLLKDAGEHLQGIYKFHLANKSSFLAVEHLLKSLYSAYNFAASLIKQAVATKTPLKGSQKLDECLEFMLNLCDNIIARLTPKK